MTSKHIEELTEPLWMIAGILALHYNYNILATVIFVRLICIALLNYLADYLTSLRSMYKRTTANQIFSKQAEEE